MAPTKIAKVQKCPSCKGTGLNSRGGKCGKCAGTKIYTVWKK
jgi:DnaJ-class molecular chaperone